ncbi:hypothetical protein DW910_16980 [Bacteroides eggerthii]|nr:hypothetical protein DW910_16980 [Bacteroides eggerthii]
MCTKMRLYFLFGYMSYDKQLIYIEQLVLLQNRRLIIEDVALLTIIAIKLLILRSFQKGVVQ